MAVAAAPISERAPDLAAAVDAAAARTGAWVVVESAGLVLAHGAGAGECHPAVVAALVRKTTAPLRAAVRWRRGSLPMRGQLDDHEVLAADLGDGATAWFFDGHQVERQLPLLVRALQSGPAVEDPYVRGLLDPNRLSRSGAAPQVQLVVAQADVHVAALASRFRPLVAGTDARLHVEGELLVVAVDGALDVADLAREVRRSVPSAVLGVVRVRPGAPNWVLAASTATAALAAARRTGLPLGDPELPEIAAELLLTEAREAVGVLVAALPAHPLGALRDYDRRTDSDLLRTLTCWAHCGFDVSVAARRLHLHSNTLRYRLKRVRQISGLDVESPRVRLLLQLLLGADLEVAGPSPAERTPALAAQPR